MHVIAQRQWEDHMTRGAQFHVAPQPTAPDVDQILESSSRLTFHRRRSRILNLGQSGDLPDR
jgi:hypothetical protein